jgi:hypothetical protein
VGYKFLRDSDSVNAQITLSEVKFEDLFNDGLFSELKIILGDQDGTEEFKMIVDVFLSCLKQKLIEFKIAYDTENWENLQRQFLNFKSISSYVGGKYLCWLSEHLGELALTDQNKTERFYIKVETFYLECDRLKQHLESEVLPKLG